MEMRVKRAIAGSQESLAWSLPVDAGTEAASCAVAVIGAGFSGTIAAILLRRHLSAAQPVYLIERSGEFARGVAYAESAVPHLLNVRSANMSAFADDPGHFERWLEGEGARWPEELRRTAAGLFATRRLYGKYLQATLQREIAASGGAVRLVSAEVQALEPCPQGWRLHLAGSVPVEARGVVLATGSLPASRPCDGADIRDPWAPEALSGLDPDAPVLIIGTGLTMVDLVLALQAQGFRGPIIALSRRGLVPQAHEPVAQRWPAPDFSAASGSALALLRTVRAELRAAAAQNTGWRAVIDSLRPLTASLWHGLKPQEQARFLRHLRPYWDVHRHRMAPPAAMLINALRASGRLRILRGRVREVRCGEGQAAVLYDECPSGARKILQVQRVIHATGLSSVRESGGLVASMLAGGQARADGQGLGLEVTPGLALVDAGGHPARHLWALGPIVRGMFWECTAVPDIRQQASQLAQEVAAVLANEMRVV